MFFFDSYYHKIIKHDLINAFYYDNLKQIPKVETIILNFGYQKSNFKRLVSCLLALEFISSRKSKLTRSKHLNIFLKIKKGSPVGCKVILKKQVMHSFYLKLITSIFPKIKFKSNQWPQNFKSISITIQNPLLFIELESQYQFFKDIPKLDITVITDSTSKNELFFLLKSIKFFL